MQHAAQISEVLEFWTGLGPAGWYAGTPAIDAQIRARFATLWQAARAGALEPWAASARGALAAVLVLDQFPRNIFRDGAESFATDHAALTLAGRAIAEGHDLATAPPLRQFFYLPFMHSEEIVAQNRAVQLFAERMPGDNLRHARAHRDVIAAFGRFPWRNAALGRPSTPQEQAFLAAGGYRKALSAYPPLQGNTK